MSHRVLPVSWLVVVLALAGCATTGGGAWPPGGGSLPTGAGGDFRTDTPAKEHVRVAVHEREPAFRPTVHREFVECPQCR